MKKIMQPFFLNPQSSLLLKPQNISTGYYALCILLLFILNTLTVNAQNNNSSADTTDKVVRVIRFSGNDHVSNGTLETLIRTQTNREFLGISRFTPWYYIWQITNGSFGEPPAQLNRQTTANDIERIEQYYQTIGFLETAVDTNIVEFKKNRMEVSFLIDEGQPSTINTIAYTGMPALEDTTRIPDFYDNSPLTRERINDSTYTYGRQYNEGELTKERNRIVDFLKNNGYAAAQNDSVRVLMKRSPDDKYQLDALFTINPGQEYTFGDLYISLAGPDDTAQYTQQDTLSTPEHTLDNKAMYLEKEPSAHTRFSLLSDQILFKPGDTFNNELYIRTVNEFQNLGMLSVQQFGLSKDGSLPDYSKQELPVMFQLKTLPRHSINVNVFGMHRYGFGSGAGLTYTNNNLFGKAENLQLSVNGSFEYVSSKTIKDIGPDSTSNSISGSFFQSFDSRLEYTLPNLNFPFTFLDENILFSNARTRYGLSFARSDQLLFDINSDIRFNLRYEVQHNNRFSSFLDLIELNLLDTTPSSEFREALEQDFGEDSIELKFLLEDFRPQVSSILRYTFQSKRTDLIKRNYGYFSEYSIAVGGNIPYLTDRFIVTPDTLEGNLPPIFPSSQNSLAYSRFVRGTADYRRYLPISNHGVFAYRGFLGMALPYGNSNSIPLNRRFYAGGTNDIRGWNVYSLGPGSIPLEKVTRSGGEIKLLGQAEIRQRFLSNFLSANWIASWFADAGNIWYGPRTKFPPSIDNSTPALGQSRRELLQQGKFKFDQFYKQIAVGSGLGFRIDWNYLIVRFDFAMRLHDLQKGWLNNNDIYFSFGIGHSF